MHILLVALFLVNFASCGTENTSGGILVGAFNIQIFGQRKANNEAVMEILAKIVKRYDIVLIQEIRDIKQTALKSLVNLVNEGANVADYYNYVISARLGRSRNKEQYAFIYRTSTVKVDQTYQYPDPNDDFEREPFAVKISLVSNDILSVNNLVLAAVHVDPDVAVDEVNALVNVHHALVEHWETDTIAILGDLNADCRYISTTALGGLALRTDPKYTWLISDDADTTTKSTHCAYDRIIVSGESLVRSVVPGSAQVYHYDVALGLNYSMTTSVSDHYPVEMVLGARDDMVKYWINMATWVAQLQQALTIES